MFFGPRTIFNNPEGLATCKMISRDDPSTEKDDDEVVVYGVNSGQNQIIYNTSMWSLALFGSKGSGKNQFLEPKGIACNPQGHVFIADSGNNRIVHLFNPRKEVSWVGTFSGKSSSDIGLSGPSRVALDESCRVYVTDTKNRRIVIFDTAGTIKRCIPDAHATWRFTTDGPTALAVADGRNRWSYFRNEQIIFCADSAGRRIWKLGFDGTVLAQITMPESFRACYAAIDYYHNLWITDRVSSVIVKFDHDLLHLDTFGSFGTKDNQFDSPRGIAIYKRYGQTFIAERSGAQYYWIGTQLKSAVLSSSTDNSSNLLTTDLTEYSYISLFGILEKDSIRILSKRMCLPGIQTMQIPGKSLFNAGKRTFLMRVEPTYSSYTYTWSYHPIQFKP
jgi:hypothetical protein